MNCTTCNLKSSVGPTYVMGGIQPSHEASTRMITMPSQNDGIERPASEKMRSA